MAFESYRHETDQPGGSSIDICRVFPLLLLALLFSLPNSQAAENDEPASNRKLNILTSFSPTFYSPFINAYKEKNPDLQLKVLNKKTTSAITEIERGNLRNFDIFWSSSPDAFAVLKKTGKLIHSGYTPDYLSINGSTNLYGDIDGYFYNFALSSVGIMWNEKVLNKNGIEKPDSLKDLEAPRFYGQLALSTPSRSGTNHLIVESLLQGMGWEEGWRFLLQASGNLETVTARSFSVPDGVANGRFGAGLVIDFLAIAKMYQQEEIRFTYGRPVFLMPATIGVLENGKDVDEAVAFIDFLLSPPGQAILLNPAIGRLPVSAAPFSGEQPHFHPLLELIQTGSTRPYNSELSKNRYLLVNALFDQLITYRLLERRRIWKKLLQMEELYGVDKVGQTGVRKQVLQLLCGVPVTEKQSFSLETNALFSATVTGELVEKKRNLIRQWENYLTGNFERAAKLLTNVNKQLVSAQQE